MSFGDQLRKLVKSRGLNFTSLAQKMGVTNAYISQLVTDTRKPGRQTLLNLSKTLEVPIDALLMLNEVGFDGNSIPRKIPVLNETGVIEWVAAGNVDSPALYADSFEYASIGDPKAFYFQPSNSNDLVYDYDLVLMEPMATIKHGDTVLACVKGSCSLGRIVMADGLAILFNERQEHILSFSTNNIDELSLFRAVQGIRNI